jgi:hypothetical protein
MQDGVLIGRITIERWLVDDDDIVEVKATTSDGSPLSVIERLGMLELAKGYPIEYEDENEESTDQ